MVEHDFNEIQPYTGETTAQPAHGGALVAVEQDRAVAEVQAAMAIAKRFPRDENTSFLRIMRACKRKSLAEKAEYAYPRGGQTVSGPSVHLARVIGQNWGNLQFGIRELNRGDGYSEMEAYCWDLETNVKASRSFVSKHQRKARGAFVSLDDERDIYEKVANDGARRERACILEVVPADIVEEAVKECAKTLKSDQIPLPDRIRALVAAFSEFGVTAKEIEARILHKIEATTEPEMVQLRKIYTSLRDGFSAPTDWFKPQPPTATPVNSEPKTEPKKERKHAAKTDAGAVERGGPAVDTHDVRDDGDTERPVLSDIQPADEQSIPSESEQLEIHVRELIESIDDKFLINLSTSGIKSDRFIRLVIAWKITAETELRGLIQRFSSMKKADAIEQIREELKKANL